MLIKIDNRESSLIYRLNQLSKEDNEIKIKVEKLEIGDIHLCDIDTESTKIIIERKSLQDLISSIKDNRYTEQSVRLSSYNLPNHNIYYLIEGNITKVDLRYTKININTIYSSLFSISYYKGFSLLQTMNIDETANLIFRFACKLKKEYNKKEPYYNVNESDNTLNNTLNYSDIIKTDKKSNITPENIINIILKQIPGVSNITANTIAEKHLTLVNLIVALQENENCLNDLTYHMKNGKIRKINSSAINNIKEYMLKE